MSTFDTRSVPKASAPIACAPPISWTSLMPSNEATTRMAGAMGGGDTSTRRLHPAICEGTPSIMAVEGSGADPPGT